MFGPPDTTRATSAFFFFSAILLFFGGFFGLPLRFYARCVLSLPLLCRYPNAHPKPLQTPLGVCVVAGTATHAAAPLKNTGRNNQNKWPKNPQKKPDSSFTSIDIAPMGGVRCSGRPRSSPPGGHPDDSQSDCV